MTANPRKHEMVRDRILDLLEGLALGAAIPAERALSDQLGVSRVTVRRAVDDLVRDGYLERRQGSGTYVAQSKLAQPLTASSFTADMERRGLRPSSRLLTVARIPAGAPLSWRLGIDPDDEVIQLRRLRLADDEPLAIETVHMPAHLVPGLPEEELERRSLYQVLSERYELRIASGTQTIEPTMTNDEESAILDIPTGSLAFLCRLTTAISDGRVIEYTRGLYRGDRYVLTAELQPSPNGDGLAYPARAVLSAAVASPIR
ncbi:GntR family transcriptional regulator [Phytoactinopolyspora alkaliphila]|uniref:GntR family transcriptional regulator n=1 Tax=Phytoactinopolyspora alkaliphila TaxID=1783498 RepID=A0A6N9YIR3_9ACTN|nr:GntR family transcriptional regulator [Phytoactinopolyspora alkaliphila]NED94896.1 GntR family transcriptional regulator [Phytoactinopolyspora alkaliphila]